MWHRRGTRAHGNSDGKHEQEHKHRHRGARVYSIRGRAEELPLIRWLASKSVEPKIEAKRFQCYLRRPSPTHRPPTRSPRFSFFYLCFASALPLSIVPRSRTRCSPLSSFPACLHTAKQTQEACSASDDCDRSIPERRGGWKEPTADRRYRVDGVRRLRKRTSVISRSLSLLRHRPCTSVGNKRLSDRCGRGSRTRDSFLASRFRGRNEGEERNDCFF